MIPRGTLVAVGLTGAAGVALWAYPRWLTDRSEEMDAADVAKPGEVVDVDGVAIHYLEQGQGPALVLIHGLGGSTYNFRRSFPGLSRHLRVVALDLKGFGYSERPAGGDYSRTAQARLVAAFMRRLDIPRAAVLGHSLGGAIAVRLAAMEPDRVERLILVGADHPNRQVPTFAATPPGEALLRFGTAVVLHHPSLREMTLRAGYYDPRALTQEAMEEFVRRSRIRGSVDAVVSTLSDAVRDEPGYRLGEEHHDRGHRDEEAHPQLRLVERQAEVPLKEDGEERDGQRDFEEDEEHGDPHGRQGLVPGLHGRRAPRGLPGWIGE